MLLLLVFAQWSSPGNTYSSGTGNSWDQNAGWGFKFNRFHSSPAPPPSRLPT